MMCVKRNDTCSRQNKGLPTPQNVHILIPETCNYVTLHGKRAFAGVVKLRTLR